MLIYTSHLSQGKRFVCKVENAKNCIEEALDSLNMRWKGRKIKQMEEQERAVKELISGNDVYNGID